MARGELLGHVRAFILAKYPVWVSETFGLNDPRWPAEIPRPFRRSEMRRWYRDEIEDRLLAAIGFVRIVPHRWPSWSPKEWAWGIAARDTDAAYIGDTLRWFSEGDGPLAPPHIESNGSRTRPKYRVLSDRPIEPETAADRWIASVVRP